MPRSFLFLVVIVCVLLCCTTVSAASEQTVSEKGFFRSWLLCGPFPNPVEKQDKMFQPRVSKGLTTDYLRVAGGETGIMPKPGLRVARSDGSETEWVAYTSPNDLIMLDQVFKEKDPACPATQMVAYAWTTVTSDYDGEAIIALGSDDGVRVWLNGSLVHDRQILRWFVEDSDIVPVILKKGTNTLLVKVDQGVGGWNFGFRIFDRHNVKITARTQPLHERTELSILAPGDVAGKTACVKQNGRTLVKMTLKAASAGCAVAACFIPFPSYPTLYETTMVTINEQYAGTVEMPDMNIYRADAFIRQEVRGYPPVFSGEQFPELEFDSPDAVRTLIGSYTLERTFYDQNGTMVTTAAQPGRYGAVVNIRSGDGKMYRRFVTLYRLPQPVEWWNLDMTLSYELPSELGVSETAAAKHSNALNDFAKMQLIHGFTEKSAGAVLLAGLNSRDDENRMPEFYSNPVQQDRRWWLNIKRKLYGWDTAYPKPFVCPRPIEGTPARVVRPGSLEQAGMLPDFPAELDAVLNEWATNTDEAFVVCVVRHGIVAFHKAYGTRDGKPMTVDTPSWMASLTKLLSGACIMMIVDQGLISLDTPVDTILPALRINPSPTPFTFRNLYTHTAGLEGHWGAEMNDMEERIALMAPYYQVGKQYTYDGTGLNLATKALEAISGETLPDFYLHHLLEPLGCNRTYSGNACGDARSIPLDMARIGQMLLQKGAYGEKRFFSEETFEQMLPRNLEYILGTKTPVVYGIGTSPFDGEGLGEGSFAHGAASAATMRIDPENDLVIVMTRNEAGENFGVYHPKFIKAIVDGMQK